MQLGILVFITLLQILFLHCAQASSIQIDPSVATASAIAPGAIIYSDLKAHVWSAHPTVGYLSGTSNIDGQGSTATSRGFGGTLEAQYSLNEHFGIEFSGLGYSGNGDYTPASGPNAPRGGSAGTSSISGWLIGASLILDPFSGEGFRMPFFFGVNYEHLSSSTPTASVITSTTLSSPGITVGFSPRFNLAFLRIEPFLVVTTPSDKGNVTCSASIVAGDCGAQNVQILPVFGVNVVYRPWNLSFYFNLSSALFGTGVSFYSLGPQLTF